VSFKPKSNLNDVVSYTDTDKSFYDLLGIPETGSLLEIKQAYKQLARKYHPDVSPPDRVEEYTQRFIRVQEAYETLSDPGMRALYDRDMAKGLHFGFSARSHEVCLLFFFNLCLSLIIECMKNTPNLTAILPFWASVILFNSNFLCCMFTTIRLNDILIYSRLAIFRLKHKIRIKRTLLCAIVESLISIISYYLKKSCSLLKNI